MINMNTNLGHLELHDEDQTFEFISSPRIRRLDHTASTAMECPRCGSINTKFCYYNNYSKTQPRHFCKACKRHWTKGGTLRNIPTGGAARKNKRQKISKAAAAAVAVAVATNTVTERDTLPPLSEFPFQSTDHPLLDNLGSFVSYGGLLDLSQQQFSFSSLSSFENNNNPSSLSTASTFDIQSSADTYSYAERVHANSMEAAPDAFIPQPWPNCWNLEDIDTLVSSHELNIPNWDDPPLV